MTTTFYITTPIYYVNDVPHLGHAYTTIVADALARFHRMRGDATRFLTGTDEHGQKVEEAARKRGLTPQQLVDEVSPRFDHTWRELGIEQYRFIRTTDAKHKATVAALWKRIRTHSPEDLYLASYQGWYCVGCEAFYTESQLQKAAPDAAGNAGWLCTIHKTPVAYVDKERSWFFRLSKYAQPLLDYLERHPEFIQPDAYRSEITSFLRSGLKDISVSRTSFSWGIPVPEADPEGLSHVVYVWMDALVNYLSDLCPPDGSLTGPDIDRYWPNAVHVIGKDILRFHAVYWPAFLLAAGLPLPKTIFAHGWWTIRGEKISKSMPATRIDPLRLADALGVGPLGRATGIDAMRYYLLREVPLGHDGDFTFESLCGRFNAELANDLGNLVSRSLTLLGKFAAAAPLRRDPGLLAQPIHRDIEANAIESIANATAAFDAIAPSRALDAIWKLVRDANRYVDANQPWALAKDPLKQTELSHVLHILAVLIDVIGGLITPVLPTTGRTLRTWVGTPEAERSTWPTEHALHRNVVLPPLAGPPTPLFPRLDAAMQQRIFTATIPPDVATGEDKSGAIGAAASAVATGANGNAAAGTAASPSDGSEPPIDPPRHSPVGNAAHPGESGVIEFGDFSKIDLRVGTVVSAIVVPKKQKLLHLHVDLGEAKPRSIVAGIAQAYQPDQLIGKQVIVVANLAPRKLAGVVSEGMILASGDGAEINGLSGIDRHVPPGTRVR